MMQIRNGLCKPSPLNLLGKVSKSNFDLSSECLVCLEWDMAENVWTEIDLVTLLGAMDLCDTTVLLSNARQMRRHVAVMFIH